MSYIPGYPTVRSSASQTRFICGVCDRLLTKQLDDAERRIIAATQNQVLVASVTTGYTDIPIYRIELLYKIMEKYK